MNKRKKLVRELETNKAIQDLFVNIARIVFERELIEYDQNVRMRARDEIEHMQDTLGKIQLMLQDIREYMLSTTEKSQDPDNSYPTEIIPKGYWLKTPIEEIFYPEESYYLDIDPPFIDDDELPF